MKLIYKIFNAWEGLFIPTAAILCVTVATGKILVNRADDIVQPKVRRTKAN